MSCLCYNAGMNNAGMNVQRELTGITSQSRLGRAVRRARKNRGLTQTELSASSGVARPMISKIESGRAKPTVETVLRLLLALRYTVTLTEVDLDSFSLAKMLDDSSDETP